MIWLIILLIAPIYLYEGIPLIKEKRWKELIIIGVLLGISLLIGIGKAVNWPTPLQILERWLLPIGKGIFKHL